VNWLNHIQGLLALITIIVGVLTLSYFIWKDRHQDLKIIKAVYGKNNIYKDITQHLNDLIEDGKLKVPLTNDIADDPVKGIPKIAKIKYWHKGKKLKREYVETELILSLLCTLDTSEFILDLLILP